MRVGGGSGDRNARCAGACVGVRLNSVDTAAAAELPCSRLPLSVIDVACLRRQPVRLLGPQGRRLRLSLLISLLAHALLLSLTLGGQEFGLPGFAFPWQDRRIEVPDLRVVLVPVPAAGGQPASTGDPLPSPPALAEQPGGAGPAVVTFRAPKPPPVRRAAARVPRSPRTAKAGPSPKAAASAARATVPRSTRTAKASPRPKTTTSAAPAKPRAAAAPSAKPFPAVIALEQSEVAELVVPAAPLEPAPALPDTPENSGGAAQTQIDQPAPERVAEDAARAESVRRESERQEAAREEAARQESARQESARQESARQEAARQESARQEAARQEAARQDAARQEAARQEAARQEAARQETARQEAARQETTRQEAARQELARQELNSLDENNFGPDYLNEQSVNQVDIDPAFVWLAIDGGIGAHGGTFQLLRFDGAALHLEIVGSSASPGVGYLEDLNNDGTAEVILREHDFYVFCYACGVRYLNFRVFTWDTVNERMLEVTLQPMLMGQQGHPARQPTNRAVELYHLTNDPGERTDLANANTEERDELLDDLLAWIQDVPAPLPAEENPGYDPKAVEKGGKKGAKAK